MSQQWSALDSIHSSSALTVREIRHALLARITKCELVKLRGLRFPNQIAEVWIEWQIESQCFKIESFTAKSNH